MRRHDTAFYTFFDGVRFDYGSAGLGLIETASVDRNNFPLLRVFASPQRAVANVVDLLVSLGWIAGNAPPGTVDAMRESAEKNFAVLPLPVLTLQRQPPVQNFLDSGVPKVFRRQCLNPATGEFEQHPWPGAYETTYTGTFWCVKRPTAVHFREWLHTQMGQRGRAENETLIPVTHADPWGTINQRLVFEQETELSELESVDNARILRFEFSFRLRTWHFRKPVGTAPYVHDIVPEVLPQPPGAGVDFDPADVETSQPGVNPLSSNLFSIYLPDNQIEADWPKAGNATVKRGAISPSGTVPHPTLRYGLELATDEALVSNRLVPLDVDTRAILTMSFKYRATADVTLQLSSYDLAGNPVTFASNRTLTLPSKIAWTQVQWFALIAEEAYSLTVLGAGTESVAYLSEINLRHVRAQAKIAPTTSTPGGGSTVHDWTGLADGNYLAVVVFDTGAAADTITVDGVAYAVDPATSTIGFVAQTSAVSGAVSVTVPDTIPTTEVYLQTYLGFWDGTEI